MIRTLSVVSLLLSPLLAHAQSDWPQFRGPGGQGISKDTNVPVKWSGNDNLAWKVELPGPGSSSPIIFGDRIYITCFSGKGTTLELHLLALKRADGSLVWTKKITPALPEGNNIRENHGYASSTPVADATGIYCYFGKSGAVAFDHDGKERWRTPIGQTLHGWGSAASPILQGNNVIINAGVETSSIVALDKSTGKEAWRAPGNKEDGWNTPILVSTKNGRTDLVLAMGGKIHGLDPATGKTVWTSRTDIGWYMVPGLVTEGDLICAIGGRSGVAALAVRAGGQGDVTKTHRLWTSTKGSNVSSPILHQGHLYYVNDVSGVAFCTKAATGDVVYQERLASNTGFYSSAVMADGKIYYTSRSGRTHVVAASPKFQELAQNDLGERSIFNSSPAIAGSKIYLRTDRYLYCVGKK